MKCVVKRLCSSDMFQVLLVAMTRRVVSPLGKTENVPGGDANGTYISKSKGRRQL